MKTAIAPEACAPVDAAPARDVGTCVAAAVLSPAAWVADIAPPAPAAPAAPPVAIVAAVPTPAAATPTPAAANMAPVATKSPPVRFGEPPIKLDTILGTVQQIAANSTVPQAMLNTVLTVSAKSAEEIVAACLVQLAAN